MKAEIRKPSSLSTLNSVPCPAKPSSRSIPRSPSHHVRHRSYLPCNHSVAVRPGSTARWQGEEGQSAEVPQGSPCSPVLFALTLAGALAQLPDGVSYVDDCTWVISFTSQREFKEKARALLDQVHARLSEFGFSMDEGKTEVAWIFAGPKPSAATRRKAENWNLRWKVPLSNQVVERRFNPKAKPVRWLGFFLDPKFNWQAHVKHRLALGHHRIKTLARVMGANGTPRQLARKVAWAVAMSTAAYGVEAIWEGQQWLADSFDKLTRTIGRTVAGTFSTTKVEDAIRAADTPPTLDRRRERLLASVLAAPHDAPKRALLPPSANDDSSRRRLSP
jgi:hypothetical protein